MFTLVLFLKLRASVKDSYLYNPVFNEMFYKFSIF